MFKSIFVMIFIV